MHLITGETLTCKKYFWKLKGFLKCQRGRAEGFFKRPSKLRPLISGNSSSLADEICLHKKGLSTNGRDLCMYAITLPQVEDAGDTSNTLFKFRI